MMENNYSIIVETLKTLYEKKKVSIASVKLMVNKGTITLNEYDYILGKKKEV